MKRLFDFYRRSYLIGRPTKKWQPGQATNVPMPPRTEPTAVKAPTGGAPYRYSLTPEWHAFCDVIGNPLWTTQPEFTTLLARKHNEEKLNGLVEKWTADHTAEEVMDLMQAKGSKDRRGTDRG